MFERLIVCVEKRRIQHQRDIPINEEYEKEEVGIVYASIDTRCRLSS